MSTTEWQMQFLAAILSRLSNGIVQFQIHTCFTRNRRDGNNMGRSIWRNTFSHSFFFSDGSIENGRVHVSRGTR